MKFYAYIFG